MEIANFGLLIPIRFQGESKARRIFFAGKARGGSISAVICDRRATQPAEKKTSELGSS
jgi:hypothetical protein